MTSNNKFKNWLPVIIFMIIAIGLRLRCNSSENHYLLAGSDGPYLPVQVKSLFEHFRLAFPDMPLLFVICTLAAKLLYLFRLGTENECILMSIRFIDSFVPPLAAIPVFYIAKELNFETTQAKFSNYLAVAFSILSFTPLFLFSFQLQKNGIATVLIFSYLYYVLKILKYKTGEDTIKAVIVLFLCAFTHFGSFGIMVFISLLVFSVWLFSQKNKFKIQTVKILLGAVGVFISTFSLIAIFDYTRFLRIINVPFKLFEAPALLFALNGQNFILHGPNLFILISMNLLAFTGIVFLILKRKQIDSDKLILGLAAGFCTLFFSNPFLGLEWASRLFMMAYIPVTVMYLIIYNSGSSYWIKIPTLSLFSLLMALSIGTSVFDRPPKSIDNDSFKELQQMSDKGLFLKNDAIVARQSLRILSNWVFGAKGVDKYLLSKDEFNKYNAVYLLRQIKGKNPGLRGSEPTIGNNILPVYQGEHFEVFLIKNNAELPDNPQKIFKGIKGTIHSIAGNKISIIDIKTNKIREVFYDPNNKNYPKLGTGMKIEVNGEWIPFSISINAETIKEIDNFDD